MDYNTYIHRHAHLIYIYIYTQYTKKSRRLTVPMHLYIKIRTFPVILSFRLSGRENIDVYLHFQPFFRVEPFTIEYFSLFN